MTCKRTKRFGERNFVTVLHTASSKLAMRPMSPYTPEESLRRLLRFFAPALLRFAAILSSPRAFAVTEAEVASPDGSIQFQVTFKSGIGYKVDLKNKAVIEPSRMIFSLNGTDLTSNAVAGDI